MQASEEIFEFDFLLNKHLCFGSIFAKHIFAHLDINHFLHNFMENAQIASFRECHILTLSLFVARAKHFV